MFAIPGSIHSPLSKGCHALIKSGAKLVESAERRARASWRGFRPSGYASTTAGEAGGAQDDARRCSPTWAMTRSMSIRCALRAGMSAEQVPPSCCAWSWTAASPRFRGAVPASGEGTTTARL